MVRSEQVSPEGGSQSQPQHQPAGGGSSQPEHSQEPHQQPESRSRLKVEAHGINVIGDADRRGRPRQLFWPWFGANVSILGLGYGSFALGFGISFWQAVVAGVIGIVFSFLLCGFIAVAGKRGSAPTMTLSRAAFGVCR
jgi:purine-cytosine permease-like protein